MCVYMYDICLIISPLHHVHSPLQHNNALPQVLLSVLSSVGQMQLHSVYIKQTMKFRAYCIAGNFGKVFNLANW